MTEQLNPIPQSYETYIQERRSRISRYGIADSSDTLMIAHGSEDKLVTAWDFLIEAGCEIDDISKVIDPETKKLRKIEPNQNIDFNNLSLEETRIVLEERLIPIYNLVNPSINKTLPGYNNHSYEDHVRHVVDKALTILDELDATEEEKKKALIIAMAHDLGNMLSRSDHPILSTDLLLARVPELEAMGEEYLEEVREGIELHDEKIAMNKINEIYAQYKNTDQESIYQKVLEYFGRSKLAVMIGDKLDTNVRRRTSSIPPNNGLDGDRITESQLFVHEGRIERDEHNISISQEFSVYIDENEEGIISAYIVNKPSGQRVQVSNLTQDYYRQGIPYILSFAGRTQKYDAYRWSVMSHGMFALFDSVRTIKMDYFDNDGFEVDELGFGVRYTLSRENLPGDITLIQSHGLEPFEKETNINGYWREITKIMREDGLRHELLSEGYNLYGGNLEDFSLPLVKNEHALTITEMYLRYSPGYLEDLSFYLDKLFQLKSKRKTDEFLQVEGNNGN